MDSAWSTCDMKGLYLSDKKYKYVCIEQIRKISMKEVAT